MARPAEPRPEPNQELLALGAANAAGGLLGAMPAGGGTSQTAVNRLAGARSQVSALVTATMALATLLLLGPVIALMPQAALAAVVIVYSIELIKPAEFAAIRRVRRTEFRWALTAFAGVVLLGTLRGILVAVVVSLLSLAQQAYNPTVYVLGRKRGTTVFRARSAEHPDDETWPGLLILRTEGRLFFANAERVADRARVLVERGAAARAGVRLPRHLRHRVHRAADVQPRSTSGWPPRGSPCGWPGSTPRRSPSCAVRRSVSASVSSACSSTSKRPFASYERQHAVHPVPVSTTSAAEDRRS